MLKSAMEQRRRVLPGVLIALALAACGGSGEPTYRLNVTPESVSTNTFERRVVGKNAFDEATVSFTVAVENPPTSTTTLSVSDSSGLFASDGVRVTKESDCRFAVLLKVPNSLRRGVFTGQVSLALCESSTCGRILPSSGGVFRYTITVTPELAIDVFLNDSLAFSTSTSVNRVFLPTLSVNCTSRVTVRANIPTSFISSSSALFDEDIAPGAPRGCSRTGSCGAVASPAIPTASPSVEWLFRFSGRANPSATYEQATLQILPADASTGAQLPIEFPFTIPPGVCPL